MIPGHGFFTTQTTSLVETLEQTGQLDNFSIKDYTAPAISLHWYADNSYFSTQAYDALLEDACAINIIMPFYNDIQLLERSDGPDDYNAWLGYLVLNIKAMNPQAQVIVLSFFPVTPSAFTQAVYTYITMDHVNMYNLGLDDACRPEGIVGRISGVICYDISGLFDELTVNHILMELTEAELNSLTTLPTDIREQVSVYFRDNPSGRVQGDGVHLSPAGKRQLSQFIANQITRNTG